MPFVHADDGTRIHYDRFGRTDGEPLVLLMGLSVDRWGWIRQRATLARRFRCIAVDNRGSGLSDKPYGDYDLFTMVEDALAVMDAEGIDSAHVMGYSLGGVLTQILAAVHPERVRSIVLASTACRMQDWRRELMHSWTEMVTDRGVGAFARENLRWVAAARHVRWATPLAPALAPLLVRAPAHAVVGQIRAMSAIDDDMYKELGGLSVPAFVIVGTQDILTPVADSEEIVHTIPHADFKVVTGAAHGMVVTDARIFNEAVSAFHDEVLAPKFHVV